MRIAEVAPLIESVPPKLYGGTERVVSYLTEQLVRMGHDVTLFASGDSVTSARLVSACPSSLRLDPDCIDPMAHLVLMLEMVLQSADSFDLIHYHVDYIHFPLSRRLLTPSVTTLHGRLDIPDLQPLYREFTDAPVISISNSQRGPLPNANWQATVYHGLPEERFTFHPEPGEYLAFVGRISREKRCDRAIEIAKAVGLPLRIAAKVDRQDQEHFESDVRPLLDHPLIDFIGEIGEDQKCDFMGQARALLFPIEWCEPFGLVMIEAMACGTPVIAFRRGSVPEIITDGETGFVVNSVEEAAAAVDKVDALDRRNCRRVFEQRFSARRMAEDYLKVFNRLLARERADVQPIILPGLENRIGA
jgi:glycosyltransferase involved in cell wall biosynthesis